MVTSRAGAVRHCRCALAVPQGEEAVEMHTSRRWNLPGKSGWYGTTVLVSKRVPGLASSKESTLFFAEQGGPTQCARTSLPREAGRGYDKLSLKRTLSSGTQGGVKQ
eukprot:scaffold3129_cov35-Tisochrysis_lutea.AAC.5